MKQFALYATLACSRKLHTEGWFTRLACSDVSLRMFCAGGAYEITHGRKYEGEGEESEF